MNDGAVTPPPPPPPPSPEALLQAAAVGIVAVDGDGSVTTANAEAARILGAAPEQLIGRRWADFDPRADDASPIHHTLRDGRTRREERAALRRADGSALSTEYTVSAIVGEGRTAGAVVTLRPAADPPRSTSATDDEERVAAEVGERTRRILESITDAFFALDRDWRFTYLNDEAERLLLRPREALIGRGIWEEFPAAVGTVFQREYERAVREGQTVAFEAFYPPPLDAWYEVRAYPSEHGLSVYFRNVSERVRTQNALRESEGRYRLATRATQDVIWDWDLQRGRILWNEALQTRFGYRLPDAESDASFWYDHVHPDDRGRVRAGIHAVIEGAGDTWTDEYRFLRADGSAAYVLDRGSVARDGEGRALRMIGAMQDVTAAREAARALGESEERYRSLVEATSAILWSTSASGGFAGEQPGWSAFTGQTQEEYSGWGWMNAIHPEDRAATSEAWTAALKERRPYEVEHRVRRADGEFRTMWVRGTPVLDADGSIREWVGIHTDITDEKRVEEALRRSEESYRFLADTIPQLVWTTLPDGYHEYYNRRWYEYTGLTYEATRGTGWNDVLHPDDQERAWTRWRRSLESGEPYSIEYRFRRHDGVYRWFLGQALPFRDAEGRITRWFGTCTDIHDHKEAQDERDRLIAALDVERARLSEVFREAPALILVTRGPRHRVELANPPFRRLVGGRDATGMAFREALPELEGQGLFELLDQVFATGEPVIGNEVPVRLDRGHGPQDGFFNFVYQPLRNSLGEMEGILVHAVEVTDQVRARQQVERLEERLRLALESGDIGTWDYKPPSGMLSWDERCKRMFGLGADARVDYSVFLRRLHPADRARVDAEVQGALDPAGRGAFDTEYRVLWDDGSTRWIRASGRAFFTGEGPLREAVRFTGTVMDETARRRAEEEREAALASRSRFYAAMSHELRTPINAILGYNDLILTGVYGELDAEQQQAIERGQRAARHLLDLVNDVLDLSKLEAGKTEVTAERCGIPELVRDLFATVRPLAEEKGSTLRMTVAHDPRPVVTDGRRVRQIVLNLLSNAIKFGDARPVEVRVRGAENGGVVVEVVDRGVGIEPADLNRVFEEFVQLPNATRGGTGLGLPISRRLAELLGGRLEAESAPGQGSVFRLVLPPNLPGSPELGTSTLLPTGPVGRRG